MTHYGGVLVFKGGGQGSEKGGEDLEIRPKVNLVTAQDHSMKGQGKKSRHIQKKHRLRRKKGTSRVRNIKIKVLEGHGT